MEERGDDNVNEPGITLKRRILIWLRDLGLLVVAFFVLSTLFGRLRAPDLEGEAPPLVLPSLSGETIDLKALRGQTVVLNFWATWCGPCRAEIPMLNAFARSNPDIPIFGVAVDGRASELRAAKERFGIQYPVLVGTRSVVKRYGATTVPTTVVIDADGQIKSAHVGLITTPQLELAVW